MPHGRYERLFQKNSERLQEMLAKYATGNFSSVDLGNFYHCDHTSILHMAKKYGVKPAPGHKARTIVRKIVVVNKKYLTPIPQPVPRTKHKYDYLLDEKINPGKSYQEYLKDERERLLKSDSTK